MAKSITVVVSLSDTTKKAGLEINTATKTWTKSEAGGANEVFTTKSGTYRVLGTSTELLRQEGGLRAGRLAPLDPLTVRNGATGQGLSDDRGAAVTWKIEGIVEI